MKAVFSAAIEIQTFCLTKKFRFCFIGGLAVARWGEPRFTEDADLTVMTGWGEEAPYVDALLSAFESRIPDARQFAIENRVLLLRAGNAVALDVALGALPFEEAAVSRASYGELVPRVSLFTCSAEDLIVHKAFAGRDQDWADIFGIVRRQGAKRIDRQLIVDELAPLLALRDDTETLARLARTIDGA